VFVFLAVFLYAGYLALRGLPSFGNPLMGVTKFYLTKGFKYIQAANLVSAINLNFRAYDTLGEATALFVAAIGVMAVMRKKARKKINESDNDD
jgi:multisubunit Na+/H+ antiporter MnhB subunit